MNQWYVLFLYSLNQHRAKKNLSIDFIIFHSDIYNIVVFYELFPKLIVKSSFRAAMFSIIVRSINPNLYTEGKFPIKLVTLFSAQSSSFETQVMYNLYKRFNIGIVYEFNLVRITPWEYFISANDNIYISILINL